MGNGRRVPNKPLFGKDDPVAVIGLGSSGVAASRLAAHLGARVYASDAVGGENQERAAEALRDEAIDAEAGHHDLEKILACRVVVVSPGVDPSTEVRRAVREAGIRTVAEVELAFRSLRSRVIAITGTNGKTTTTALTGHLLASAGVDVMTAGNIGRPLSEVALLEEQPEWVAVELSSFQLADLDVFDPDIGVLLNLAPDHLDRYASLDRYYEDKGRMFANADEESRWVLNGDDDAVLGMVKGVPGRKYETSLKGPVEWGAWLDEDGALRLRLPDREERWARVNELQLLGRHNVMNALLAGTTAALAGCGAEDIGRGLREFEGLPHRLRPVGEWESILWVNDSKGTNCSATRVALESFSRRVVAILGGRHKGERLELLIPPLRARARGIIAFGEAAPKIVAELGEEVPTVRIASGMEALVREAARLAEPGDVVLFSPACSSHDMFPDYEARGTAFEDAVLRLHGEQVGA